MSDRELGNKNFNNNYINLLRNYIKKIKFVHLEWYNDCRRTCEIRCY